MASFPQPPLFSSLLPSKPQSPNLLTFKSSRIPSPNSPQSSPNSESRPISEISGYAEVPSSVKLAFEKAGEYKKGKTEEAEGGSVSKAETKDEVKGEKEVPLAVKLAMEKANEYKKTKGDGGGGGKENLPAADKQSKSSKKEQLSVSSMDFVGLNFADKKIGRGLPAGLVPQSDPFPAGKLPEVEILVGDATKFGDAAIPDEEEEEEEEDDVNALLYKPKVSTWGVFPRPNNISKTVSHLRKLRPC